MTPKENSRPRKPAGPTPPKANYSRELTEAEYQAVLRESARISESAKTVEAFSF